MANSSGAEVPEDHLSINKAIIDVILRNREALPPPFSNLLKITYHQDC
jgi:hypothetical protein